MVELRVSGCVIIRDDTGQILLVRQSPEKGGQWGPPAGHGEEEESPLDTARREGAEETGYTVLLEFDILLDDGTILCAPARPIGSFFKDSSWGYVFSGTVIGERKPLAPDISETAWFSPEEIHALFAEGMIYRASINLPLLVHILTEREANFIQAENQRQGTELWLR